MSGKRSLPLCVACILSATVACCGADQQAETTPEQEGSTDPVGQTSTAPEPTQVSPEPQADPGPTDSNPDLATPVDRRFVLAEAQAEQASLATTYSDEHHERQRIAAQIGLLRAAVADDGALSADEQCQLLNRLLASVIHREFEETQLLNEYSDAHPDVVALRARIQVLEERSQEITCER